MSSAAAAQLAMRTESGAAPDEVGSSLQQGLAAVAVYIPSEALAGFIGLWGLFAVISPTQAFGNALVVLGALLIPFFIAVGFNFKLRRHRNKATLLIVFGLIAYAAWILALPGGPWKGTWSILGTSAPSETLGGGIVLVLALVMPPIAKRLKLRS